ncbi:ecto-NOX disulfide-thiol exchanger 2 [Nephila pilipes]|uniref:Ecto-NOX disulfide-thiol exchanger 2 n=1 Tax=Nephila pilipes TaxID=299642 RepID=A0A8X6UNG2_NEPPI|nr:ecto-NOX disulfide-thiol exchanger 2 [Nephila pilipes]
MEENNNSDFESELQYSGESSTSHSGQSSNNQLHVKSRDRKNKKRSRSPENDWNKPCKNKDTSERMKIQKTNDAKDDDKRNGNQPYEVMGTAQMPNPLHQRMAVTISPTPTMMHQPPIYTGPYPPYAFGPQENFIDHNHGNYAMMPSYNMMSMPSQWPINNALPIPTSNVEISPNVCGTPVSNGMELMPSSNSGMVPYPYMGMGSEPSTYGMVPPIYNYYPQQVMTNPSIIPQFTPNTHIPLSNLVLIPPLPGEIINRRVKPDGCRTVYVGNLPEKMTQDMVNEIFQMCGSILTIRMSEKNFCHIRFVDMESVEQALLLSEYRIKIENNDEPAYNGKMHVDYATARDDQHDFECRKRQMEREERHRARASPPSPPPMPHYSEHEAISVNEKLRNGETFKESVRVLMAWFEKGECTRRNSGIFYSMLQSTHSNVKRLANEKAKFEEEMKSTKEKLDILTRSIQVELSETEKVYIAAKVQKNWDHFSKNQRKHRRMGKGNQKFFSCFDYC